MNFTLVLKWPILAILAFVWTNRSLIRTADSQDATNFVLIYFTILVLNNLEYPKDLPFIWSHIPKLSLFQIVRKPDFLKKWLRPYRVAMAPVSFTLTIFAGLMQLYFHFEDLRW